MQKKKRSPFFYLLEFASSSWTMDQIYPQYQYIMDRELPVLFPVLLSFLGPVQELVVAPDPWTKYAPQY